MINYSSISVTESSPTEPVTLTEVKAWLTIDFPDHDTLLTSMITGARQSIEQYLNLALVPKTIGLDIEFPGEDQKAVTLPYTSGLSGVVVDELDEEDLTTTLASGTDYFIRGNQVRLSPGRYHVSYTTVPGTIPEALKEAIKMEVAERYSNRGEASTGLSDGAKQKCDPFKIIWL